jgi:non-canonical poly(A) RNA polymerase PAPD5/7
MLSLRDPADKTNDLGRKGIAIKHVQATFDSLYEQLVMDLESNTRPSLLAPLVGTSYMLNRKRRERLEAHGKYLQDHVQETLAAKAKEVREADRKKRLGQQGIVGPQTSTNHVEPAKPVEEEEKPHQV